MTFKNIFFALVAAFFIFLTACGSGNSELEVLANKVEPGVEVAKDVEIYYSDSSIVRAYIKAPEMKNYGADPNNPKRVFDKGVEVKFYDATKQPTSYLKSRKAVRYEMQGRVELRDSVQVWNAKQERIEAEVLIWDEQKERITSEGIVKIRQQSQIITGYGLDSDLNFENWTLSQVTGIVKAETLGR